MLAHELMMLALVSIAIPQDPTEQPIKPGEPTVRSYTVARQLPYTTMRQVPSVASYRELNSTDGRLLGLRLTEPDAALRAQIDLPANEGLVVQMVERSGAFHAAGLQPGDILLNLDGKALTKVEALSEQVQAARDTPVSLKLLRQGKPLTLELRTEKIIMFLPAKKPEKADADPTRSDAPTDYYFGIQTRPLDAILRSHLKLEQTGKNYGLVVEEVVAGSPAEKAGLKTNDILLNLNKTPLYSNDFLRAQARASAGKAVPLDLIRNGKLQTVEIAAVPRPAGVAPSEGNDAPLTWSQYMGQSSNNGVPTWNASARFEADPTHFGFFDPAKPGDFQGQWQTTTPLYFVAQPQPTSHDAAGLQQEVDALKAQVEALKKALEASKPINAKQDGEPEGRDR